MEAQKKGEGLKVKGKGIHFVGIGGVGMSALAWILLQKGEVVSGSDIKKTAPIQRLQESGATVYIGHRRENIENARLLVVSSAISSSNPELLEARKRGIRIISRAEMLAELMKGKKGIIITGSHGKTTTTSMISLILDRAGFNPGFAIGGYVDALEGNANAGRGEYFVAEADESDGSFLKLSPWIAVATNIEAEHLNYYGSMDALKRAFWKFVSGIPSCGTAILNADCKNVMQIIRKKDSLKCRVIAYTVKKMDADFCAVDIHLNEWSSRFTVIEKNRKLGILELQVPGLHNVSNALAATAAGLKTGIEFERIKSALKDFRGAHRRFEKKGEEKGVLVIDDYAHHPSEIDATMRAARNLKRRRLIVIFQPHRYSRTKLLGKELGRALSHTDVVIVTRIYSAGEKAIKGVDPGLILGGIKSRYKKYIGDREKIISCVMNILRPGDLLLTMGAGDVYTIGEEILERLKRK